MNLFRRPRSTLGAKLLSFSVLLVVGSGAVYAWASLRAARVALERAVGRQLAEVAQDGADGIDAEISRLASSARAWARQDLMREVRIGDVDKRVSQFLASLRASDASLRAVVCADADGRVVAASDPALLGTDVRDRPWWRDVLRGEDVAVPSRRADGARSLELAAPIPDLEGGPDAIGAVVIDFSVERLNGVLEHLQHDLAVLGLEADLLLLDENGVVIAGGWWKEASDLVGQDLRRAGWAAAELVANGKQPSYLRQESNAALVGTAVVPSRSLGWSVLAVQSFQEAFAPVRALRRTLLLALAAILLSAVVVAALIAERLSRPIRELTRATRELARTGELPAPVAVAARDEIGDLAAAFNGMAADLKKARADVLTAAKLAFAGEIAAGMTHEIRTPLGIVRSSAQILGRSLREDDERGRELVAMIVEEVDRLDRVVAGLLELARPRAPLFESAALAGILSRALEFVSHRASERGIALRADVATPLPEAWCDPDQIYQVALNLLMNALQILPAGGTIAVRTFAANGRVGFEVADDGPGMTAEVRDNVFTPFFTRRPGGTGLGLAVVQGIVHAHRGVVGVESEPGRGAVFRVELPVAEEAA